eukprot:2592623-Prymnesium_polylepis.1
MERERELLDESATSGRGTKSTLGRLVVYIKSDGELTVRSHQPNELISLLLPLFSFYFADWAAHDNVTRKQTNSAQIMR